MDNNFLKDLNVLFVDDDSVIIKQFKILFEDSVRSVFLASGADEALKVLSDTKAIDVLITDILMPNKNGIELIREIKKQNMEVGAIIVVSAHSEAEYLLEAIKLKVDGYILKPLNIKEVFEAIERSIKPHRQEKEILLREKIFDAVNVFVGGKKIEIIRYVYENSNEEGLFFGSYEDIMQALDISKPTVVATFRQLIESGLIARVKNKVYKIR